MGNEEQELTKEQIWDYDHAEIFGVIALSADGNNIEGYEKDFSGHEQLHEKFTELIHSVEEHKEFVQKLTKKHEGVCISVIAKRASDQIGFDLPSEGMKILENIGIALSVKIAIDEDDAFESEIEGTDPSGRLRGEIAFRVYDSEKEINTDIYLGNGVVVSGKKGEQCTPKKVYPKNVWILKKQYDGNTKLMESFEDMVTNIASNKDCVKSLIDTYETVWLTVFARGELDEICLLIPPTNLAIFDELGLDIGFDTLLY